MSGKNPETEHAPTFPDSSFKYTPLRHVRVLFIRFCQGLFGAAPPGNYHWDPDEERSELIITNESKLDPETINRRPGIHFTRGPCQFYSLGIGDMVSLDVTTERKEKGVLVPGTMTINLVSRVQQETEDLAWVVAEHYWLLDDVLKRAGFFDIGRQPQIGSPSPAGSIVANDVGDEFTVTPVTVPWQFARNSSFTPLGKRIVQNIEQNLTTSTKAVGSLGPAYHPFEYPVQATVCPPEPFTSASDTRGASPDPAGKRSVFLPKQPHPLNPATTVSVRTVRAFRPGVRVRRVGDSIPIIDPCVEESDS